MGIFKSKMASSRSKSTSKDYKDFRDKKTWDSGKVASKESSETQNVFANDGSFFEMFQQKMKEMEQTKFDESKSAGETKLKHDNKKANQTEKETSDDSKAGTSSLSMQGKRRVATGRMGGASKQLTAKKKKEEKDKEKERTVEQEGDDKS